MTQKKVDVLLVGAGVMSATLASLLSHLDPSLKIMMVERLSKVAHESTHSLNNAGTGHGGYCELNYTPQLADGSIRIDRALEINAAFEVSLQFWSYLVKQGILPEPEKFINPICHQSFVWGEEDVAFLRKRHAALHKHHLFEEMEFSEDHAVLRKWMPLVMKHRDASQAVAATRVKHGTDVDFGLLTRKLVKSLTKHSTFDLMLSHTIVSMKQHDDGRWHVRVQDNHAGETRTIDAGFVFLGAGGGALPLLQKSGIPEARGYGGFPVSGQWLICKNPEVVKRHCSKVYGKAAVGAPPMSVPHLDARIIDGEPALLFGPFASITTKFLKEGSVLDLFSSLKTDNLKPMLAVARDNLDLTRYLITEAFRSHKERMAILRGFYIDAKEEDWELASAGQRVQIIKSCDKKGGKLEFGTEIVTANDGTLAALLGASPGASTSVQAMIEVIERCFKPRMKSADWKHKMKEMIPSYGESLDENVALLHEVRRHTLSTLRLG
ncbi:malate dehydrogenase (quinone) [Sideroxydans lithotrophicus]|uniref:Probable malate:quinone oxidoreductase n=1 Tax=Sideroxydans lithotrophicus (strain ES-1) TaxID=580332 RepID=D5CM73_SIDLE|nr:malate dehydrogenase (quinone) [Sideroxydans lithotrophicus]ADE10687.1 malate/quinone oxidoreductase [Sideroxydans lithotrophicus ES-1]